MQLVGDGGRAVTEVAFAIGIARPPSGAQKNDRSRDDGSVPLFPGANVFCGQSIIGIALRADVDHGGGSDQLLQRNGVDTPALLGEMDRRVEMRSSVLRRAERVR